MEFLHKILLNHFIPYRFKIQSNTPGRNGGKERAAVIYQKKDHCVGRRLFNSFQKSILSLYLAVQIFGLETVLDPEALQNAINDFMNQYLNSMTAGGGAL